MSDTHLTHSGVARKQANKSKGFVTNPKRYINNRTAGNGVKKTTLIVHILQLYTFFFLYKITHRHHRNVCIHVYEYRTPGSIERECGRVELLILYLTH